MAANNETPKLFCLKLIDRSSKFIKSYQPGLPDGTYICIPKIPIWGNFGGP
jgi:hypothetical protein